MGSGALFGVLCFYSRCAPPAGRSPVPVWLVSVHLCHVVSGHSGLVRKAWVFCMMQELLSRNVAGNPDSLQAVIFSTWFIDGLLAF